MYLPHKFDLKINLTLTKGLAHSKYPPDMNYYYYSAFLYFHLLGLSPP